MGWSDAYPLTANQFAGFQHLLVSLGHPNVKQADVDRRLSALAVQCGLADSEKLALAALALDFRQTLSTFAPAITKDQAVYIVQVREARIRELALRLIRQLPVAKQQRILDNFEEPSHMHGVPSRH